MRIIITILCVLAVNMLTAQTNVSAGLVYGTWKKSGSPYKINGQISVPKDSTLRIESGVKVEFQGVYMLHVYGSLQALGKIADSVLFTPSNKTAGWQGIHVHGNTNPKDSFIMEYFRIEYVNFRNLTTKTHGAIGLDTCNKVRISNGLFYKNSSNVGGGLRCIQSSINCYNLNFQLNSATDNSSTTTVASGSAIYLNKCLAFLNNITFRNNSCSLPNNYTADSVNGHSKGALYVANSTVELKNSLFIQNTARGPASVYYSLDNSSKLALENNRFIANYSSNKATIDAEIFTNSPVTLKNDYFEGNIIGRIFGTPSAIQLAWANTNSSLTGCTFIKQSGYASVSARKINIANCKFFCADSLALYLTKSSGSVISNSIFTSNGLAIDVSDNASVVVTNCIITNNGTKEKQGSLFKGGLLMSYSGNYMIYNSIIQNNYNRNGMANLLGGFGGTTCQALKNSIVQGGTDSAKLLYLSGNMSFNNKSNVINDTVQFVKPPGGVGPAHYNPNNDFHIKNTCTYVYPGWNAGLNLFTDAYSGITINNANTTDLDGNPRIRCGTVDIGPYELEGSKQSISIDTEPTDQSICPKTIASIAPSACGAGLSYQWQQSTNGTTFSNISGANNVNYSIKPQDSGWYRLIITQAECNKKDTSRAAKIALKAGGKMSLITNAKDSTLCNKQPIALQANITNANSYQWQESNDGSTFSNINGATANPYNTNTSNTQWYRLIAKNTLCNYSDTFAAAKVTVNPLPTPNLGADIAIPNSGNKVLNPGTFTTYSWSTGATTPTITVDKTNLAIGANNISVEVTGTNRCKAADTIIVTLEPANGLRDPSEAGIKVYPVPATETLHLDFPQEINAGNYTVCGMDGRVIKSGELKKNTEIQLSELASGSYLLKLEIDGKVYSTRVVK